ncbi:MAG TPA: hypothetical protein VGK27_08585 [Candidatus Deferrimicrobiaceae bacterium]|jgi:hypothetical protein
MPRLVAIVCLFSLLAFGCAGVKPRPASPPSVLSDQAAKTGIRAGVQSLADFRRARIEAESRNRTPDFAPARKALGDSLAVLRPAGGALGPVELEGAVLALETACVAMDTIIAATANGDARSEAVGWEMLDQSVGAILLTAKPIQGG